LIGELIDNEHSKWKIYRLDIGGHELVVKILYNGSNTILIRKVSDNFEDFELLSGAYLRIKDLIDSQQNLVSYFESW
jgi:hypothetical protein